MHIHRERPSSTFAGWDHTASDNSNSNYNHTARKHVAAGKLVAERTQLARNNRTTEKSRNWGCYHNSKEQGESHHCGPWAIPDYRKRKPRCSGEKNSSLSITQWLAVGSLVISLVRLYYKHEQVKAIFSKKNPWASACWATTCLHDTAQRCKTNGLNIYTCNSINMKKVDAPHVFISTASIFGIGLLWYDFNIKVFRTVHNLLNIDKLPGGANF